MSFDGRDQLHVTAAQSKSADYRVKDLLTAPVASELFEKR